MKYALGGVGKHGCALEVLLDSEDPVAILQEKDKRKDDVRHVAFAVEEDAPSPLTWDYAMQHRIQLAVAYKDPAVKVDRPCIIVGLQTKDEVWKAVRQLILDGLEEGIPMVWQPAKPFCRPFTWEDVKEATIPWKALHPG